MKATHCMRGHVRTPENLRPNGTCRICARELERARQERLRIAEGRERRAYDPEIYPCGHPRTPENTKGGNAACKTCNREKQRRRYHLDPQRHSDAASRWQRENRERADERQREWRERNREQVLARGRKAAAARRVTDSETLAYLEVLAGDPCSYCGSPSGAADHIRAISRGGTNDWWNYTAACGTCNGEKHAADLLQFLMRRQRRAKSAA